MCCRNEYLVQNIKKCIIKRARITKVTLVEFINRQMNNDMNNLVNTHKHLKIVLVETIPIFRQALSKFIASQDGLELICAVDSVSKFSDACPHKQPVDIVIVNESVDSFLQPSTLVHQVLRVQSKARVILITQARNSQPIRRMFEAGAKGVLHNSFEFDEFLLAVRTLAEGKIYLSPSIEPDIGKLIALQQEEPKVLFSNLDFQVFLNLALGVSNAEIATKLNKQPSYISLRRKNIEKTLNVYSSTELLQLALQHAYIRNVDGRFVVLR